MSLSAKRSDGEAGQWSAITEISSFHDTGTFLLPSPTSDRLCTCRPSSCWGGHCLAEGTEETPLPLDTLPPSPGSPFPNADSLLCSKEQLKRLPHSRMIDDRGFQVALDARSAGRSKDEPQGSNCYVAMSTSISVHISLMPPTAMKNLR